ncbi:hypothetical protein L873DRAFT_355200 [Choiromyces venosus 120613-1]|uniref:Uncharacterized protein n=1 Tax=Choiromyces venosus 120613-1 TaxID=1336337 RepID=A0A3N4IXV7_9PEZI|nr:hypothetical protein L873DRAFT_355200 [Choiromyces venosus 120613-1]
MRVKDFVSFPQSARGTLPSYSNYSVHYIFLRYISVHYIDREWAHGLSVCYISVRYTTDHYPTSRTLIISPQFLGYAPALRIPETKDRILPGAWPRSLAYRYLSAYRKIRYNENLVKSKASTAYHFSLISTKLFIFRCAVFFRMPSCTLVAECLHPPLH